MRKQKLILSTNLNIEAEMLGPSLRSVGSSCVLNCVREDAVERTKRGLLVLLIEEEEELVAFPILELC